MDSTTLREKFLKLEEDLDLFNIKINEVYFWERIRFQIYRKIATSLGISGQAHTKPRWSFFHKVFFCLRTFYYILNKNPFFSKKVDILFYGHPRRKLLEDGKWWDIYCDPIIEQINESDYIYFESHYLNSHLRPAKTKNIKYLDVVRLIVAFKRKLGFARLNLTNEEEVFLKQFERKIEKDFGIKIELRNIVHGNLIDRKIKLVIYKYLLQKINPKIVVLVGSYGKETFIEACKTLKIPDFAYSFPGSRRTKRTFPDYLFTFGDFWKKYVEFPIKKDCIFSVGYPFLEKEIDKYREVIKKNQILFISQGSSGRELSKFAVDVANYSNLNYNVVYKLHPGEYGNIIAGKENIHGFIKREIR